jgi:hypothetical protein
MLNLETPKHHKRYYCIRNVAREYTSFLGDSATVRQQFDTGHRRPDGDKVPRIVLFALINMFDEFWPWE